MKKRYFAATLVGLTLLTACTNEEPKEPATHNHSEHTTHETSPDSKNTVQESLLELQSPEDAPNDSNAPTLIPVTDATAYQQELVQAIEVIEKNLLAAQNEDIRTYMETVLAADSTMTKAAVLNSFQQFDMEYKANNFELVAISEDKQVMEVKATHTSIEKNGSKDFSDSEYVATHTLTLDDGKYKISKTIIDETTIRSLEN